ncbi:MAG: amidohydrolase [Deltaproteobacteria bacterium]|nr:amidohydrolase [Deltaproteobacteria bacterium]
MKRLATILAALGIGCARLSGPEPADLVLRHGSVYLGEAGAARAESLAIRSGKLAYVGPDSGIAPYIGADTRSVELGGRLVLPAFHDAHVHPISAGLAAIRCPLAGISDRDALEGRIRDCAESQRGRAWVEGSGWELPVFGAANPRAELLDALVPDRPALLRSADGHSAWANSRALAAAGVTRDTPDPANGRIERDPSSGEPSGTLREAAMELVARAAPATTAQDLELALGRGLAELARLGVVCAHEANATPAYWDAYLAYGKSGAPGPRVRAALALPPDFASVDPLPALEAARASAHGDRVRAEAVKLFLDGVIEARTAALIEPYEGGDERGSTLLAPDALDALVARLDAAGFQVHMHAIGDRAARIGLDAVERARAAAPAGGTRHTIAHLQLVAADDLMRFAGLGVAANVQALWAQADPYITELTIPLIGDERSLDLYPIGSLFANADVVAAGSDWPVSSADPLAAIEVGVTRRADDSGPGPGWLPEQRADLAQMLAAYTRGGAWLDGEERERGRLAPGMAADLVVLDRDLFELEPHEISSARVLWTLADGETIWLDAPTPLAGAR